LACNLDGAAELNRLAISCLKVLHHRPFRRRCCTSRSNGALDEGPRRFLQCPLRPSQQETGELITVYFSPDGGAFAPPPPTGKGGHPRPYSDAHIEALLTVKVLLRLSLRAVGGFARGMAALARADWPVPNYSTLSRRERKLAVDLGAVTRPDRKRVLLVGSTGLKVFGEGEWKVRIHGTDGKRRTWRKIHLLVAAETTPNNVADCEVLPALLPADLAGDLVLGDGGAYHTKELHRTVHAKGGTLLSPRPLMRASGAPSVRPVEPALQFRNSQLTRLQMLGRTSWKVASGYSQRSFVESTNHRLKSLTGDCRSARTADLQCVEVLLRCKALNTPATSTWQAQA